MHVHVADGTRLSMLHFKGSGPAVMLLHGLAANSLIFDLPQRSLARFLAQNDFDVFLPELRGHGASDWPSQSWGMREYLTLDIPAILDAICRASGQSQVHWIGHSMGGILSLCYGILSSDTRVASVLTIGSALTMRYGDCFYKRYIPFKSLISFLKSIPLGIIFRVISPLVGRNRLSFIDRPTVCSRNIESDLSRNFHRLGFCSVPFSLLLDLLCAFDERGLALKGQANGCDFYFWENRERLTLPLRMFAASEDYNVPPDSVIQTAKAMNCENELYVFGKKHGCLEEYGHCDLIIGKNASREVWPRILSWLQGEWRGRSSDRSG
jgi:pimeloyl-ACP methyl ester carboxylesterase